MGWFRPLGFRVLRIIIYYACFEKVLLLSRLHSIYTFTVSVHDSELKCVLCLVTNFKMHFAQAADILAKDGISAEVNSMQ